MGLKVIGAGLGRTGTASLKVALEQLGIGRCYHMGEVLANLDVVGLWVEAGRGKPDWDRLFDGYSAAVDYPSCTFWREQLAFYPEAKVLLSTRDPDSWFESVNSTVMSADVNEWIAAGNMKEFFELCVWRDFGADILKRDFMVDYFRQREAEIRQAVPPERLLVLDVREGWQPLCDFLQVPVPDSPFPRVNSREETRALLDALVRTGDDQELRSTLESQHGHLFDTKPE